MIHPLIDHPSHLLPVTPPETIIQAAQTTMSLPFPLLEPPPNTPAAYIPAPNLSRALKRKAPATALSFRYLHNSSPIRAQKYINDDFNPPRTRSNQPRLRRMDAGPPTPLPSQHPYCTTPRLSILTTLTVNPKTALDQLSELVSEFVQRSRWLSTSYSILLGRSEIAVQSR